ncbi:MAG: hypothetical protein R3C15_16705 [Thermoleophilia bacterium]
MTVVTSAAAVEPDDTVAIDVRCPPSAVLCSTRLTVQLEQRRTKRCPPRPIVLGRAASVIPAGMTTTLVARLLPAAGPRLARGPVQATVRLTATDALGRTLTGTRKVLLALAPPAAKPLLLGISDDHTATRPIEALTALQGVGARAVRVVLPWTPGQTAIGQADASRLQRAAQAWGGSVRIVALVTGATADAAPQDDGSRDAFCSFARSVLVAVPSIRDVAIWIEPNKATFWRPQFAPDGTSAAPAAYAALLARCWDVLHQARSDVNVIGPSTSSRGNDRPNARSNVSHSPGAFVRKLGAAYRTSGRTQPILDTVSHHPYGENAAERPSRLHAGSTTIGLGDWAALMQAWYDGFSGTGQPIPGQGGVTIWYLETGFQTRPDAAKASLYHGTETDPSALLDGGASDPAAGAETTPAPDQATQLQDAIRLATCQPGVGGYFTFLLWDEPDLDRWQSAPYWADGTPKRSAAVLRAVSEEAASGAVDCRTLRGRRPPSAFRPRTTVAVQQLLWPRAVRFHPRNDMWRFRLAAGEDAIVEARVIRLVKTGRALRRVDPPARQTVQAVRGGYFVFVTFPRGALPLGKYRFEAVVRSAASSARVSTLVGPPFTVAPRPKKR